MRRWVGTGLAAISCLAAVVGCGVPTGGVVGVTVDAAGRPAVVVQMCEGHIWSATHLEFSERDLERLQAGTVLVPSADPDSTSNVTHSLPDFRSKTCEDWF